MSLRALTFSAALAVLCLAPAASAQGYLCEDHFKLESPAAAGLNPVPESPAAIPPGVPVAPDPLAQQKLRYSEIASNHRLCGLASFYSASLENTLTANGERYHNRRLSAAHLTLPLGTWVDVRSRASGRTVRLRVNDRGPYVGKFMLDLSYAAAHALGVDLAADRHVDVRIVALPGEEPLPKELDWTIAGSEEEPSPAIAAR